MNATLAMTQSLTAMKLFGGSDPKMCRKWLKMSVSMQDLQEIDLY